MDNALAPYVERLQRLPSEIASHSALFFAPSIMGYRGYAFGCKSGPSASVADMLHEMAHAAEFGGEAFEERATETGFLLRSRSIWVFDRFCEEPLTTKSIERELRTFAHQHHLQALADIEVPQATYRHECASLMRHMPDWLNVPGRTEDARIAHCAERIATLIGQIQPEDTIQRLKGWLDKTQQRLAMSPAYEAENTEGRFHADGERFDRERILQARPTRQTCSL